MPDIKQFFEAFSDAYGDKNAERIAECYRQPCVLMSDDKKHMYSTRQEITDFANHVLARFEKVGAVNHAATVLHSLKMSDDIIFVQVKWEASDESHTRLFGCHVSYTLKIDNQDSLKIMISVLDDEEKALSQLLDEQ
jgi:ketosteroid isomerase-like protein